jgi:hypothetical protein
VADQSDVFSALKSAALTSVYPPVLSVSGTATAGDMLTVTATPSQGSPIGLVPPPITFSYTVEAGDSPAVMAYWLYASFQAAAPLFCGLSATLDGATLTFTANPGVWTLAPEVSGAGTETLTVTTVPASGISPIAGVQVLTVSGWPTANDLDAIAASPSLQISTGAPLRAIVSVYAPQGYFRDTTRYQLEWQTLTPPVKTLTASVADNTVTIGGTVTSPQNVVLIVGAGNWNRTYVHAVQPTDTLFSIATALADRISGDTPAIALGATVLIPDAFRLAARIGGQGTVINEIGRQIERYQMHVWAPSPAVRDAVARPIRNSLADIAFLALADGTAAQLKICGDHLIDDPQKAGLYRRTLFFDVEYGTTVTQPAAEITVFEAQHQAAQVPEAAVRAAALDPGIPAVSGTNPTATAMSMPEAFIELNDLTSYTLPNGLVVDQRVLISDNLGHAESVRPVIYGNFNVGSSFQFTQNYESIEPIWDGTQWVLA